MSQPCDLPLQPNGSKVQWSYLPKQFSAERIAAVLDGLREMIPSGDLTLGKSVAEFEGRFADLVGSRHAIGVASGTEHKPWIREKLARILIDMAGGTTCCHAQETRQPHRRGTLEGVESPIAHWEGVGQVSRGQRRFLSCLERVFYLGRHPPEERDPRQTEYSSSRHSLCLLPSPNSNL